MINIVELDTINHLVFLIIIDEFRNDCYDRKA